MASNSYKKPLNYEPYICRLTKAQKKLVEKEFFEVDENRGKWIEELRQWSIQNHAIDWCRQDGLFLLRFLRYTKFARWCAAPVLAQEALARYLAMIHIYPEWCRGLDPRGELMQKMIHDEVFTILGTDSAGQMIVWIRLGLFDVENLDAIVLLRYAIMFLELIADHEPVQICGVKVLVDYRDTTWKHFLRYQHDHLWQFKKVVEKVMPVWIREVHNVGLPDIASSMRTFLCDVGIDLRKYKTYWHASSANSRIYFERANWPEEYGGPCNATRQAGYLKRWFEEKRHLLMELDRMDINTTLNDIRFFKPNYAGPVGTNTGVNFNIEQNESMTLVKSEFGKNTRKANGQSTSEAPKKKTVKKACKCEKFKHVKSKVDTGLKKKPVNQRRTC